MKNAKELIGYAAKDPSGIIVSLGNLLLKAMALPSTPISVVRCLWLTRIIENFLLLVIV